jgi:hypothetical protein
MYRICSIVGAAAAGGGGGDGGAAAGTGGGGKESLCVTVSCGYATTVITITNPSNIADHSSNS